jgi:hypothetical protein
LTYTLYNQDGVAATAQEVYDALMAGTVYLHVQNVYHLVTNWQWFDSTGGASDNNNVVAVGMGTGDGEIIVGALPRPPFE